MTLSCKNSECDDLIRFQKFVTLQILLTVIHDFQSLKKRGDCWWCISHVVSITTLLQNWLLRLKISYTFIDFNIKNYNVIAMFLSLLLCIFLHSLAIYLFSFLHADTFFSFTTTFQYLSKSTFRLISIFTRSRTTKDLNAACITLKTNWRAYNDSFIVVSDLCHFQDDWSWKWDGKQVLSQLSPTSHWSEILFCDGKVVRYG